MQIIASENPFRRVSSCRARGILYTAGRAPEYTHIRLRGFLDQVFRSPLSKDIRYISVVPLSAVVRWLGIPDADCRRSAEVSLWVCVPEAARRLPTHSDRRKQSLPMYAVSGSQSLQGRVAESSSFSTCVPVGLLRNGVVHQLLQNRDF